MEEIQVEENGVNNEEENKAEEEKNKLDLAFNNVKPKKESFVFD